MIDFINDSTENIAQQLLWKLLVYKKNWVFYSGYIVETEAYLWSADMACHSYNWRRTKKKWIYVFTLMTYLYLHYSHT
jgi:DNA-3-methyladenine glycosylase